jgi:hypothetical protein
MNYIYWRGRLNLGIEIILNETLIYTGKIVIVLNAF